jgi:hypothetical protein
MLTEAQRSRTTATRLTAALALAMAVRAVIAWPDLPEPMASHFDGNGYPNGFQSRATFMSFIFGIQALLAVSFMLPPRLMRFIPPRLLSLPYRAYWMKPENIGEALDRYASWSVWFGFTSAALMLGVFELALQANLAREPLNSSLMWLLVGGYLLGTLLAIVRLVVILKPPR